MSFMPLLSSNASGYNFKGSTLFCNLLAIYSSISYTRRVTVLRDKLVFFNLSLFSGHNRLAVYTIHSFKNSPSEKSLLAFANLNPSTKLALVIDS